MTTNENDKRKTKQIERHKDGNKKLHFTFKNFQT